MKKSTTVEKPRASGQRPASGHTRAAGKAPSVVKAQGVSVTPSTKKSITKKVPARRVSSTTPTARKGAGSKAVAKSAALKSALKKRSAPGILSLDVGGTGLKVTVIDNNGTMLHERVRVATPHPCPPALLLKLVREMAEQLPPYDRIAVGFPGVIRDGHVLTAVNLGNDAWVNFDLAGALSETLGGYPAHVVNDADMQGYGLITGKGLEMVATLGTGVGTALFREGELMPHMELAHHPIKGDKTYDEYLGDAELKRIGKKRWNKRLSRALKLFDVLLHPDRIFLGGGNSRLVTLDLANHIVIGSNEAGIEGGAALWRKR